MDKIDEKGISASGGSSPGKKITRREAMKRLALGAGAGIAGIALADKADAGCCCLIPDLSAGSGGYGGYSDYGGSGDAGYFDYGNYRINYNSDMYLPRFDSSYKSYSYHSLQKYMSLS